MVTQMAEDPSVLKHYPSELSLLIGRVLKNKAAKENRDNARKAKKVKLPLTP